MRIIIFLSLFSLQLFPQNSGCKLEIYKEKNYERINAKNDYIEIEILPEYGGVISKYNFKNEGILFPFKIYKEEVYPGSPVFIERTNLAGYTDWIWPGGGNLRKGKYDYKINECGREKISISLFNKKDGIEREVVLYNNSSLLEIKVKKESGNSFWFHPVFLIGGEFDENDFLFIPVAKSDKRIRNLTDISEKEEIKSFHPVENNYFYSPSQGWFCIIDKKKKLVGGVLIEKVHIDGNIVFYSWNGNFIEKNGITLEVIFPEKTNQIKAYLVALNGFENISYISPNIAVDLEPVKDKYKRGEDIYFTLNISSPKLMERIKVELMLGDNKKDFLFEKLSPENCISVRDKIKGIEKEGRYKFYFKIFKDNELIEDFFILKEMEICKN
jgi:hypothetical protein